MFSSGLNYSHNNNNNDNNNDNNDKLCFFSWKTNGIISDNWGLYTINSKNKREVG